MTLMEIRGMRFVITLSPEIARYTKLSYKKSQTMDRKDFLLHIIKQIGDFQMQHWKSDITPSEKRDALDLVSFVDLESEKMFAQGVQKHFPEDNILGEETHDPDKQYSGQDSIWIIDPLDGTMSFLRGHPIWGVSIAYLQNDQTILAALYFPAL